jgi:hypothetical protein
VSAPKIETSLDVAERVARRVAGGLCTIPEALREAYDAGFRNGDLSQQSFQRAEIKPRRRVRRVEGE